MSSSPLINHHLLSKKKLSHQQLNRSNLLNEKDLLNLEHDNKRFSKELDEDEELNKSLKNLNDLKWNTNLIDIDNNNNLSLELTLNNEQLNNSSYSLSSSKSNKKKVKPPPITSINTSNLQTPSLQTPIISYASPFFTNPSKTSLMANNLLQQQQNNNIASLLNAFLSNSPLPTSAQANYLNLANGSANDLKNGGGIFKFPSISDNTNNALNFNLLNGFKSKDAARDLSIKNNSNKKSINVDSASNFDYNLNN